MYRSRSPTMMLKNPSHDNETRATNNAHGSTSMCDKGGLDDEQSSSKVSTNSITDMVSLSKDFKPGDYDVICARGKQAYNHPGNRRFRDVVEENLADYSNCQTKLDKSLVVSKIVDSTRQASPEGGFVKNVEGRWYEVGDRNAREKVGQAFRDLLHTQYRSSTKAKALRKKERAASPAPSSPVISAQSAMSPATRSRTICKFVIAHPCACAYTSYQTGPSSSPNKTFPPARPQLDMFLKHTEGQISKNRRRRSSGLSSIGSAFPSFSGLDTSNHSRLDPINFDSDPFEEAVDRVFLPYPKTTLQDTLEFDFQESNLCGEVTGGLMH